jgi:hypothetical protein
LDKKWDSYYYFEWILSDLSANRGFWGYCWVLIRQSHLLALHFS